MVKRAAKMGRLNSFPKKIKKPIVIITSCKRAITAPGANKKSKRNPINTKIRSHVRTMAKKPLLLSSATTLGPTNSSEMSVKELKEVFLDKFSEISLGRLRPG